MSQTRIAFIGAGNMASALIGGLIADGTAKDSIIASDPNTDQRSRLHDSYGICTVDNNAEAISDADVVVLAVKPQLLQQVCNELSSHLKDKHCLIVSIAAGIRCSTMSKWLNSDLPIVRCMPNTPAMLQVGATGLYATDNASNEQRDQAERILRAVGITLWVNEEADIDSVTAVSGSGPAYYFLMMEAMQAAAEKLGLPAETAKLLTLQTALGAARMALESQDDPATLRQKVTSPGGTTEQAILSFEENGLRDIFEQAMTAARDRSISLSEQLDKD
jgi:pyrroline-5-carboxylate reductase